MTRSHLKDRLRIFMIDESKKYIDKESYGFDNQKEKQRILMLWHLLEYVPYYEEDQIDDVFSKSKCL